MTGALSRPPLSETAAALLRDRLMAGQARAGERARLEQAAEDTGLSITPVRDLLPMLRAEAMVDRQPRRGHVRRPDRRCPSRGRGRGPARSRGAATGPEGVT
ncbi:GntR family transcriptional regulator [Dactylosporangium matsuzakiense]|uniref:HTH gntR-type domain-containing protein n=1 Tax=Dactylosporangium matsuzakiense TaxID=53360 RepID=A0A9W6KTP7_9ACTN|nr:GntR family transcriptional regulator [Dactylosporangium matsuzakiense]GLL07098.1 hypothetical protein GCM10017581_088500 [Dactylosporangium matsuzakiense]